MRHFRALAHTRLASLFIILPLLVVLVTLCCSDKNPQQPDDGDPPPPPPLVPLDTTSVAVDTSEIGASSVRVLSAWDEEKIISASQGADLSVSEEGAQLLFALDSSNKLRGLALSIPGVHGKASGEEIRFGARSTALSLLMMSPGILTVDPSEARARITELSSLPEFGTFESALRTRLRSQALSDVVQDPEVDSLGAAVLRAWLTEDTTRARKLGILAPAVGGFSVEVTNTQNRANTRMLLTNSAWRFVNVYRRELQWGGAEKQVVPVADGLNSVMGARPFSWVSLFTSTLNTPTTRQDTVDFTASRNVGSAQYWITGPGFGASATLPPTVSSDNLDAWGMSLTYYAVFPIIDLILGTSNLLGRAADVAYAWSTARAATPDVRLLIDSDPLGLPTAAVNSIIRISTLLAGALKVGGGLGLSGAAWTCVWYILVIIGLLPAAFNVGFMAGNWLFLPSAALIQVASPFPNTPPVASFVIEPQSGPPSTVFQFDASASSDAETPWANLRVRWDWEDNGSWDTEYATTKTATHSYSTEGQKVIRLQVADDGGLIGSTLRTVTVTPAQDATPPAAVTNLAVDSPTNTSLTLRWTAPGDDSLTGTASQYDIRYATSSGTSWASMTQVTGEPAPRAAGSSESFTVTGLSPNTLYYFRLKTADEALNWSGLSNQASGRTSPAGNTPPTACFTPTPNSGTTSTDFQFDASCSSDNEDPLSSLQVRWDWENDGVWDHPPGGGYTTTKTASHRYGTTGTKTIRLEVRDTGGLTNQTTRNVTVSAGNTPPTACFTPTPNSGTTSTDFQFNASCSSDNEDPLSSLQVRWDWENDGVWDHPPGGGYTTEKTASHRYGTTGTKTIRLEVRDTGGLTNQTTRNVVVEDDPRPPDMVLIPAGTFTMGSDPDEGWFMERPEHYPYISAFWIGKYEVTNAEYAAALNWAIANGRAYWDGFDVVQSSTNSTRYLHVDYYRRRIDWSGSDFVVESDYEDHPVVMVTWYGSAAFCNWRSEQEERTPCYNTTTWECNFSANGYRLPTEAEWEKAARGPSDERTYPWGEEEPDCSRVNAGIETGSDIWCVGETAPVGSYPTGRSPYGLYNMAGNVWEWCNDWYSPTYYSVSPSTDPRGPSTDRGRSARGGGYPDDADRLRCSARGPAYTPPDLLDGMGNLGFRCVRSE